jgi:quinol monooxygenase YgiN
MLYSKIDQINDKAKASLEEFAHLVEEVREESGGTLYGVNMKLPENTEDQFKVILRIMEKMFKKELTRDRVKSIIQKIDDKLEAQAKTGEVSSLQVVRLIIEVWTNEITNILQKRMRRGIQTTCAIKDLVRGKLLYHDVEELFKAAEMTEELCRRNDYTIVEFENRLNKPQARDMVFNIEINGAVCELRLAMQQDQQDQHLSKLFH